jgi:D-alanyl-D-alanine-carboxypeptidase/D-alanyl-D-alanine-endopeptidase
MKLKFKFIFNLGIVGDAVRGCQAPFREPGQPAAPDILGPMPRAASLFLLLLLLPGAPGAEPAPRTRPIQRLDGTSISAADLTARIEDLVEKARVHGLAVSVLNGREPVYSRTFGVKRTDTKEPLRTDTVLYGASLSKAVFAVLVLRLVEEGVIDLDTPLHKYLDRPVATLEASRPKAWHEDLRTLAGDPRHLKVTARMCLSHTTGLPNWRWYEDDRKLRFHFEPGARYSYSGEGLTFLQVVLERLTKKPLDELMREKVFRPYGMATSSYTWQPRFEGNFSHGHDEAGKVLEKDKDNAARSASTLETTPEDYTRFLKAVLQRRGLRERSWKEMFSPQVRILSKRQFGPLAWEDTADNDAIQLGYGLGWGVFETPHGPAAFKEGHGDGFEHYSIVFPARGTGVLLMANSANGESTFKELLELTIADTFTPWEWQDYVPWDRQRTAGRRAREAAAPSGRAAPGGRPPARGRGSAPR